MRHRSAPLEAARANGPHWPLFLLEINAMAQQSSELKATARPRAGKGAARQARRDGKVPGVIYGDGKPPRGSLILALSHGGQDDTVVWMEDDWGEPHQAFGYTYRVLNPPELKPRSVRIARAALTASR